jgi:hypothetical protein
MYVAESSNYQPRNAMSAVGIGITGVLSHFQSRITVGHGMNELVVALRYKPYYREAMILGLISL